MPLLDDFNRPDGPLGPNWGDFAGVDVFAISSNAATGSADAICMQYWDEISPDTDCEVFSTISVVPDTNRFVLLGLRLTGVSNLLTLGGYMAGFQKLDGADSLVIRRVVSGLSEVIATVDAETEIENGVGLLFRAVGDELSLWLDSGSGFTEVLSVTDSTYPDAGYYGMAVEGVTVRVDDFWAGGVDLDVLLSGESLVEVEAQASIETRTHLSGAVDIEASSSGDLEVQRILSGNAVVGTSLVGTLTVEDEFDEAGVIVRWADDKNFVCAYRTATHVMLIKVVDDVPTILLDREVPYEEGQPIRVAALENKFSVYYGNRKIGPTITINDAALQSGTMHGLYSSSLSPHFDNFLVRH